MQYYGVGKIDTVRVIRDKLTSELKNIVSRYRPCDTDDGLRRAIPSIWFRYVPFNRGREVVPCVELPISFHPKPSQTRFRRRVSKDPRGFQYCKRRPRTSAKCKVWRLDLSKRKLSISNQMTPSNFRLVQLLELQRSHILSTVPRSI